MVRKCEKCLKKNNVFLVKKLDLNDNRCKFSEMRSAIKSNVDGLLKRGTVKVIQKKMFLEMRMSFQVALYFPLSPTRTTKNFVKQDLSSGVPGIG